ncbi:putative cullin family protein [Teratosphaeria destructans]|uniref:Cullin family protein n=1 Tax=Teratosphaeria destructans TaxID=418781 RepID=A0A9W7T1L9_9PEZI|nr:putative cullin family protein [Teratosphaeria destructans]
MTSLAGRGGKAKIRPPRRGIGGADVDFETTWATLESAFRQIHTKNASVLSFEELYRNAYKLVLKKKGEDLYHRVAQFEENWLGNNVRTAIVQTLTPPVMLADSTARTLHSSIERRTAGEGFLRQLKSSWDDHQVCMGMLTDVLMYMDRVYCTDHRQPSIFAKSMGLFRDQILRAPVRPNEPAMLDILMRVILEQIAMDREGEGIDAFLIKSNVYMLEGLYDSDQEVEDEKLYLRSFERRFLQTSADFYRIEAERLLRESDAGQYCRQAKRRIDEEQDRCRSTLSESTAPKIQRVVEDELIRNKMKGLIEMDTGVQSMVANDKFDEIGLVFELEARVDPKKPELTKAIQKIIEEMGTNINNNAIAASQAQPQATTAGAEEGDDDGAKDDGKAKARPTPTKAVNQQTVAALKWVEDILALKDQFDIITKRSFNSDQTVTTALNRSTADVINAFARSSEYISLFIDDNMKKGIKNKTEQEVDATLDKAIVVLRYLQDKDVFETYYKKHLCKRLILKKSESIEVEKQMISRMKIELGNSFTLKLEAMFKDMTLSEELSESYRKHVQGMGERDPARVDLSIKVLTTMTWPLEAFRGGASQDEDKDTRPQIVYPPAIQRVKTGFEHFYNQKHSGRKLTWVTSMGDADVRCRFPNSRHPVHEINCSTYAMLILLLFNDIPAGATLTLEEIEAQTNIPMGDLTRNLQSLAVAPKTRFLVKEPMTRDVNPGDRFRFNEAFTSKTMRMKVGVVSAGNKVEGDKERKETEKKNNDSRGFAIEAAVVRIMKQRKELAHAQLLGETIDQCAKQFRPDVNMIKKRIESLIEREYLERMEEASVPSYRYLA